MSQQGGSPTGHEDDWWGQLYDETTEDTGPTPVPDTLDDRFASAAGAVGGADNGGTGNGAIDAGGDGYDRSRSSRAEATSPPPRAGIVPQRTPWEPSPAMTVDEPAPAAPTGPTTFAAPADGHTSRETPAATAPPATSTTDAAPGTPTTQRAEDDL
ncbi:hypothetical protein ACNQKR_08450, partial [Streptomyces sp. AF1B]